jgi:ribosomal-protein-alanine N-acetyltransferase
MNALFRAMTVEDLPAVTAIEQACYSSPWTGEGIMRELAKENIIIARVAVCKEVVGYSISWKAADEMQLGKITTDARFRRQGIGRRLLDDVLRIAGDEGCTVVYLEVRRSNLAAIGLYKSCCFIESGVRKDYYSYPSEDALLFKKEL